MRFPEPKNIKQLQSFLGPVSYTHLLRMSCSIHCLKHISNQHDLKISNEKTKTMASGESIQPNQHCSQGNSLEQVSRFNYLGRVIGIENETGRDKIIEVSDDVQHYTQYTNCLLYTSRCV